jgi:hypothetical protein
VITDKKAAVEKELREVRTPAYIVNTSQIFNFSRNFLTLRRERDSNPRTAPIRINLTVLFGRGSGESETETRI